MTTDGMGRWVYHGHNGDMGKVKRLKDNLPFATWASLSRGGGGSKRACSLRSGTVLRVHKSGGRNRTLSSSVRLTRTTAKKQRPHKEIKQAGEARQLAEVSQEGSKGS